MYDFFCEKLFALQDIVFFYNIYSPFHLDLERNVVQSTEIDPFPNVFVIVKVPQTHLVDPVGKWKKKM